MDVSPEEKSWFSVLDAHQPMSKTKWEEEDALFCVVLGICPLSICEDYKFEKRETFWRRDR